MTTTPYRWPYDDVVHGPRLALVVAGAQQSWARRTTDPYRVREVLIESAQLVRNVGGSVVWLRHRELVPAPRHRAEEDTFVVAITELDHDWSLIPEGGDVVVQAAGIDGFFGSCLDATLRWRGITHVAIGGFGLEGPVHSTLRSANDRGFECLLVNDASAALDDELRAAALSTVEMSGGIFGAVGQLSDLAELLSTQRVRTEETTKNDEGDY